MVDYLFYSCKINNINKFIGKFFDNPFLFLNPDFGHTYTIVTGVQQRVNGVERPSHALMAILFSAGDDCLLLGQQSFANLEFDLSQMWIEKGLQLLSKEGEQEGVESKIKRITTMMEKQKKVVSKNFQCKDRYVNFKESYSCIESHK